MNIRVNLHNIMKIRCFLCLLFLGLLAGCGSKDTVSLVETNFIDEVPLQGNLTFTFDQALIEDSLLNRIDSTEFIRFTPSIPGHFSWQNSQVLVFTPRKALLPATNYQAEVATSWLKDKKLGLEGNKTFSFHTPGLRLDRTHAYWAEREKGSEKFYLHLEMETNYPLEVASLANSAQVKVEGENRKLEFISQGNSKNISAFIPDHAMTEDAVEIDLTLSSGITPLGGNSPSEETLNSNVIVASPMLLSVTNLDAQHDGIQGIITINTSQQVKADRLKSFVSLEPRLNYDVKIYPQKIELISEDFDLSTQYKVSLKKDLRGILGGVLKSSYSQDFSFGKLQPSISFKDGKAVYLSSKGNHQVGVSIINVPKVKLTIRKIYENNILRFLGGNDYYYYDEYDGGGNYNFYEASSLGDIVWEEEIETNSLPYQGKVRFLDFDFDDKLASYEGLYVINVQASKPYYLNANKVVSFSDIGLIVKEGRQQLTVFANSIKSTDPLANVELHFVGSNNQVLGTSTTDQSGVAIFNKPNSELSGFNLEMVTAKLGRDYTYLPLNRTRVGTSRFEVGGMRENSTGLTAYLYGERDIYRPGETIHLAGIVRQKEWKLAGNLPLKLVINDPRGNNFATLRKTLDDQGGFEANIPLSDASPTGSYYAQLYSSNDKLLTSQRIAVEEFIPDRIKVDVELDKNEIGAGETVRLNGLAENFFGPPAADKNYEVELNLRRAYFSAPDYSDYGFSIEDLNNNFESVRRAGKTDQSGKFEEIVQIANGQDNTGKMQADFFVTVFDETGRPVNQRTEVIDIYTQKTFFGIKSTGYYFGTGQKVAFPLIAVDKNGKAVNNARARVRLIKHEYKTVLARSGSYFRYRSEKEENVLVDQEVNIGSSGYNFSHVPQLSGRYELRVSPVGVDRYVSRDFYAYGYGYTSNSSFEVNTEGRIDIELDRESYEVGEKAQVLLKTPFSGKVLVTLEQDKVIRHFYINTDKRSASFSLDIEDNMLPNIYVTATLVRPHQPSELPLTVAHGFAPLIVEKKERNMNVEIEAEELSRSRTKQKITVKAVPGAMVAVAAVDEGILQLTNYKTPDPYAYFYQKRALEVSSHDVYPFLFPEYRVRSGKPGGGGMDLSKRVNPLVNNRVKLASFWSGLQKADNGGRVSFEIDIPQFSGSLRVMAVAYEGEAFGNATQSMRVADPLVLSAGIPRALSPEDKFTMPVSLSNTTDKQASAKARLRVEGPLKIAGSDNQQINIPANSERSIEFNLGADCCIGQGKIIVEVDALGEKFVNETEITIRPTSPLQKRSGAGVIDGGKNQAVNMDTRSFIPQSVNKKLIVSRSPMVEFADDLDYLLAYPHGCVEQTVSRAFPQLYYREIAEAIMKKGSGADQSRTNVIAAIQRLQTMQTYQGGLTFWPQSGYVSWWGSVYAAHFLTEAQKAGYYVPQTMLDKLYNYLAEQTEDVKPEIYYYNSNQRREVIPRELPYSLFVLALAGKPQRSVMNYYRARRGKLTLEGQYMLASSYALVGDMGRYKEILPQAYAGEEAVSTLGGSFASAIRNEALALYMLLEVQPDNSQVSVMAKHISEALKSGRYLNTQERAFSFIALGKLSSKTAGTNIYADILIGGKKLGAFDGSKAFTYSTDQPDADFSINTKGNGKLYYFWETEGISEDGSFIEEDKFIKVRRNFYTRDGSLVSSNQFEQNDLIVVELSIESLTNSNVENVVITDIFPSGFEIENPRLNNLPGLTWIKNKCTPDYFDIRDDRVNLYVNISSNRKNPCKYYYVVRAVSSGTYQLGPVAADAMYNAEYHSYSGGGSVTISDN